MGEVRKGSGLLNGYLDRKQLPDSLALLPPPPAPGSAQASAEMDALKRTRALPDTPRWALATNDAELKFPAAASTLECALQAPISEQGTPNLYMLLRRTLTDAGLAKDGSYPSGHTSAGWAWALVLVQAVALR